MRRTNRHLISLLRPVASAARFSPMSPISLEVARAPIKSGALMLMSRSSNCPTRLVRPAGFVIFAFGSAPASRWIAARGAIPPFAMFLDGGVRRVRSEVQFAGHLTVPNSR